MTTHPVESNGFQGFKLYPAYRDSGVECLGEIPAHWTTKRVKNLARFVTSGSRGWAEYYSDEGPLFLRIVNLNSGSIDLHLGDVQCVRPPGWSISPRGSRHK